jgi:hypothetical protein
MGKHIHADLMLEYAKDAAESMTPWDKWECKTPSYPEWEDCITHPLWHQLNKYRRIEDVCKVSVNGETMEFVKPTPIWDTEVYIVSGTGSINKVYVSESIATFHATFKNIEDAENYSKVIRKILGESV